MGHERSKCIDQTIHTFDPGLRCGAQSDLGYTCTIERSKHAGYHHVGAHRHRGEWWVWPDACWDAEEASDDLFADLGL